MTITTATPVGNWRPRHLSHSAIEKFVQCPMTYYNMYVKKSPFVASRAMLIGTLFGKMIEDAHGGVDFSGNDLVSSDYLIAEALHKHHQQLRPNERELVDHAGLDIVYRMFDLYLSRDGGVYRGQAEYEFLVYLPGCGPKEGPVPVPLKGFMDLRVETEPLIIEAKTSSWMDSPKWGWDQRRVDSSPQAAIYHYVDKVLHGRDSEVRYLLMGYGDRGVTMKELSTHPTPDRIESVVEDGGNLWQALKDEHFECVCGKCKVGVA